MKPPRPRMGPGLPRRGRARADRGRRRQRCRWRRHLLLGRRGVRLPHPLPDGADHHRLRRRAGDGGPPGRVHRQGVGRAHPRGVPLAHDGLRHHGVRHRQHRAHGDRVRRDRHRLRPLRRVALPVGPHRRRRHLVPGAVRLLPLRRAGLPPLDASSSSPTPLPPFSPTPTGSRWPPTPCGPTSSPASRSSSSPSP